MLDFDTAIKRLEGSQSYKECLSKISDMLHEDAISPALMGELVIHCYKVFTY